MISKFHYFEDYEVADSYSKPTVYAARTVSAADVVNFGCLTADYSQNHLDRHYMAKSIYGERVAHGLLGSSMLTGFLSLNAPHLVGRGVPGAYLYGFEANYRGGLKVEDTIHVQYRVAEKIDAAAYPGYGLIKTAYEVLNQDEVAIYNGTVSTLVRKASAKDAKLQLKPEVPWEVEEIVPNPEQVWYAEDHPIGKGGTSDGRTITEADIVRFAGITGDYNPRYVDAEFAKQDIFGERIAHEMLVFTTAFAQRELHVRRCFKRPRSAFAGHLSDQATFLAPVKIGDTIRCRYKLAACRISQRRPEAGIITHELLFINQRNEVVQKGRLLSMVASKTTASKAAA